MTNKDLIELLEELTSFPVETEWIEFKMGKGSITDEEIGEYISAMSNGATVKNKPFGYLIWGVENKTHIAKATGQKADYSKNKGMDKQYYFDFILQSIKQHGSLSRKDIDELLWNKLPDILNDEQKRNRIRNLIFELKASNKIKNNGTKKTPDWILEIK